MGYTGARVLDVSIAGTIAVAIGILFGLAFIFAPKRGMLSILSHRRKEAKKLVS